MTTASDPRPASAIERTATDRNMRWYEQPLLHGLVLAGLWVQALVVSWRKWPDPVVDFGRELYIPWQLSEGAVLYRDVDDFYGPLSQYFNAGIFAVFGPGVIVLVWANIVLFSVMAGLLYGLLRKAWGGGVALLGSALFVTVFGCARFSGVGCFNYIAPYAHEATHGILVVLLLLWASHRWLSAPSWRSAGAMGLMLGLALVLKAEIILVAAVLCLCVAALHLIAGRRFCPTSLTAFLVMAALPSLAFLAYFSVHLPASEAWTAAGRAWYNVLIDQRYLSEGAQLRYSGLDAIGPNLGRHLLSAMGAAIVFILLVGVVGKLKQLPAAVAKVGGPLLVISTAGLALAAGELWVDVGRCLLALLLVYIGLMIYDGVGQGGAALDRDPRWRLRLLFALVGAALMARMVLNGRLGQFGFYQAAIGTIVVLAVAIAELPERVRFALPQERRWLRAAVTALVLAGGVCLAREARFNYGAMTVAMGEGRDRFFIWEGLASLNRPLQFLKGAPTGDTLLELPEGLMFNYLLRKRSPVSTFYSAVREDWQEQDQVEVLEYNPPQWILFVPRDMSEAGVASYGERSGAGKDIMEWVARDYVEAGSGLQVPIRPGTVYLFRNRELVDIASR